MAAIGKLTVRCLFADDTTATFTIDGINPQVGIASGAIQAIKNFNAIRGGDLADKMKSKNGANWIGIDRAVYTITDRQYIF